MAKAEQEGIPYSALSPEQRRRYDLLLAGLDLLDQAIAVFDATPKLVTWNKAMLRLLDFPESMVRVGTPFEDFARFNAERGEYGPGEVETLVRERVAAARSFQPHYVERARPNGRILAVRGVPIPNLGFVSLWTDITEQRHYAEVIEQQNVQLEARVRERTAELEAANTRLAQANIEIDDIADAHDDRIGHRTHIEPLHQGPGRRDDHGRSGLWIPQPVQDIADHGTRGGGDDTDHAGQKRQRLLAGSLAQRLGLFLECGGIHRLALGQRDDFLLGGEVVVVGLQFAPHGAIVGGDVVAVHVDQVQQHARAFDMAEKAGAEAGTLVRTFNQARDVGNHEAAIIVATDHSQIRMQCRERIVGHFGPCCGYCANQR